MLYAFGSNSAGQLGLGHQEDVSVPSLHAGTSDVAAQDPVRVAAGGSHSLILYASGQLSCTVPSGSKTPDLHSSIDVIGHESKLCSATWEASFTCSRKNCVTASGKGEKGELGLGHGIVEVALPGLPLSIPFPEKHEISIVDMASGVQHSVVVLSNGDVIGWGNGRKGQLGEPADVIWKPRKVDGIPFKVNRAVCGREFTYLLGDRSTGLHMILGPDKWDLRSKAPETVPPWKDVGASWGSIFVLLESGDIISWGRNDHGQLPPSRLPKVDKMAVGSEHAIAVTKSNGICTWGWGEHGNCGPTVDEAGDVKGGHWNTIELPGDETTPIRGIGAGCATSWIWT